MNILTKHDALYSLKPNTTWTWKGFAYADLDWRDSTTKPTEAEIDAEFTKIQAAQPMVKLREYRDWKIAQSDWRANSDVTLSDDWKTYRQALRDITKSASPKLDEFGNLDMSSVTWPTEPS
tara:strand:- start:156 stop:518 length:363 start_codon:yes stop_codon:yes gene_type:complete